RGPGGAGANPTRPSGARVSWSPCPPAARLARQHGARPAFTRTVQGPPGGSGTAKSPEPERSGGRGQTGSVLGSPAPALGRAGPPGPCPTATRHPPRPAASTAPPASPAPPKHRPANRPRGRAQPYSKGPPNPQGPGAHTAIPAKPSRPLQPSAALRHLRRPRLPPVVAEVVHPACRGEQRDDRAHHQLQRAPRLEQQLAAGRVERPCREQAH